jgi:hypothetical protein
MWAVGFMCPLEGGIHNTKRLSNFFLVLPGALSVITIFRLIGRDSIRETRRMNKIWCGVYSQDISSSKPATRLLDKHARGRTHTHI